MAGARLSKHALRQIWQALQVLGSLCPVQCSLLHCCVARACGSVGRPYWYPTHCARPQD